MSVRALFLDYGPGEDRGVVTLDGWPERLIIVSGDLPSGQALGARSIARVRRIERGLASAFLEMAEGPDAILALTGEAASLAEGAAVEIEIAAEARLGKSAVARLIRRGEGAPRMVAEAPSLTERLVAFAPGATPKTGLAAREIADAAEAEALAVEHGLPGGGSIAIEPTRALTAIDIDLGERGGRGGDAKRSAQAVNLAAIDTAARLLRLKGLGGLIAIDLVGAGHNGAVIAARAKAAFAADEPGVSIGPISRFGLLQLVVPRRGTPIGELLLGPDGAPTARALALRLLRGVERQAWADGGARLTARCAPVVAEAAKPYISVLAERIGARFEIVADAALPLDRFEIETR
jgi:Ribonuclease G/E